MRGLAYAVIMCVVGASACGRAAAAAPAQTTAVDPCAGAVRYHMPEGVETGSPPQSIAPAALPGTEPKLALPDTVTFPLRYRVLSDPTYEDTNLDLGRLAVDRSSNAVTLDGLALSDPLEADLQARCAEASAQTKSARPHPRGQ